jgi:hypothetical protein
MQNREGRGIAGRFEFLVGDHAVLSLVFAGKHSPAAFGSIRKWDAAEKIRRIGF